MYKDDWSRYDHRLVDSYMMVVVVVAVVIVSTNRKDVSSPALVVVDAAGKKVSMEMAAGSRFLLIPLKIW